MNEMAHDNYSGFQLTLAKRVLKFWSLQLNFMEASAQLRIV